MGSLGGQTLGPRNFSGFLPILLKNRRKYIWKMYAEKDNGDRMKGREGGRGVGGTSQSSTATQVRSMGIIFRVIYSLLLLPSSIIIRETFLSRRLKKNIVTAPSVVKNRVRETVYQSFSFFFSFFFHFMNLFRNNNSIPNREEITQPVQRVKRKFRVSNQIPRFEIPREASGCFYSPRFYWFCEMHAFYYGYSVMFPLLAKRISKIEFFEKPTCTTCSRFFRFFPSPFPSFFLYLFRSDRCCAMGRDFFPRAYTHARVKFF